MLITFVQKKKKKKGVSEELSTFEEYGLRKKKQMDVCSILEHQTISGLCDFTLITAGLTKL